VSEAAAAGGSAFCDLHTHSTASDGILAPERVVETAKRRGLTAIALTDHDTIDGLAAAREAGERLGVRVIAATELSAFLDGHEVHLLALHLSRLDALEHRLRELRAQRHSRGQKIVEKLNALGVAVTFEEVLQQSAGGAVGRPHVARALMARGVVHDFHEAFARYLGGSGAAYVPKEILSLEDAISIAHEAGGLAIWAHPGDAGRRERMEPLIAAGLDGVEIRHPSHSREDVKRLEALCTFFDLLPSGGSDWHGSEEGPRQLGSMNVPMEWLARQDEKVASVAAVAGGQEWK
jgi:predicted metal-dependent phosphoesterase TrpH